MRSDSGIVDSPDFNSSQLTETMCQPGGAEGGPLDGGDRSVVDGEVLLQTDSAPGSVGSGLLSRFLLAFRLQISRFTVRIQHLYEQDRIPALLISLTTHTLALLILAILSFPRESGGRGKTALEVGFRAESLMEADEVELQLASDSAPTSSQVAAEVQQQADHPSSDMPITALQYAPRELDGNQQVNSLENPLQQKLQAMSSLSMDAAFVTTGVEGRRPEQRSELALKRGGSIESERAVEMALEWLANHQAASGAWPLDHNHGDCNGQCRNPGSRERFDPAGTGLALLAFLGAGYTHFDGKYQQNVRRGIYFLRQVVEDTPQGMSFLHQSESGMYNHGIAAFALCEAYQLTNDPDLKEICQRAIDFILMAQSYQGGWGYLPKQPGDLTISGWQMMALKSASAAGLEVPPSTLWRSINFLDSQMAVEDATYFYRTPDEKSMACTAIGILLRLFLGHSWTDPQIIRGLNTIASHDDYGTDIYFRYYTTLALFHVGGPLWENWNRQCRDYLVNTQAQQGHERGSWYFEDQFGRVGGRLYTTAMAAMTLEVYYRFSPLYQQTDQPFEL